MYKKSIIKRNTGITLVALVITIIVLLILAGVTISLTLGENGLLGRAEESKNAHLAGERNDIEFMNSAYEYMNPYFGEGGSSNPGEDIPNPPAPPEESKLTEGEKTALNSNGIKELGKSEITNDNLKDNENIKAVITGEVPIPTGAEYKEGTKDTGVVVAFDDSEFVWVPVPEISEMARLQTGSDVNYEGVLYNFSGTTATEMTDYGVGTTEYREPTYISDKDGEPAYLNVINEILGTNYAVGKDFKPDLQTDYNEMVASVIKYKGFFVGRYETSLDENKKAKSKVGVLPATATVSSGNMWYGLYAHNKKMAEANNYTSVKSHMIWGSNYDAMLRWALNGADAGKVDTTGNAISSSDIIVFETGKVTVEGKIDRINNIYDLEGNGREWTAEGWSTRSRIERGGASALGYLAAPPSARALSFPNNSNAYTTSRVMLYVK